MAADDSDTPPAAYLEALAKQAHSEGIDPDEFAARVTNAVRGPSRRGVLKAGGALGAGALLGGGGAAATGMASADADTNDSDGDVGQPGDRVDVFADGVDSTSVTTGEQNNNEINLTSLVEDGTYADIGDAIANGTQTGRRHVIEPGIYQVGTNYTLTEDAREVVAYGSDENWNTAYATDQHPVVIEWTGDSTTDLFTVGDGSNETQGWTFKGIRFKPSPDDGGRNAFFFNGSSNAVNTRNYRFIDCAFDGFGGPAIDVNDPNYNFGHIYRRCRFQHNGAQTSLGNQTTLYDAYLLADNGTTPALNLNASSQAFAFVGETTGDGNSALRIEFGCEVHLKNLEGPGGSSGSVGVTTDDVSAGEPPQIYGRMHGWDIGVQQVDGGVKIFASIFNTNTAKVEQTGGGQVHGGTLLVGNYLPTDIVQASDNQSMRVVTNRNVSNVAASDVPSGMIIVDNDRDGAGTGSLVVGGDNQGKPPRYIDFDGSL